eukprot:2600990-Pyramimonas_sp.AAC.1
METAAPCSRSEGSSGCTSRAVCNGEVVLLCSESLQDPEWVLTYVMGLWFYTTSSRDVALRWPIVPQAPPVYRAEEFRRAAMKACTAIDSRTRLLRVLRACHCIPPAFAEGQLVFVGRQGRAGSGKLSGPRVIILPAAGGSRISARGPLRHALDEKIRDATENDSR